MPHSGSVVSGISWSISISRKRPKA